MDRKIAVWVLAFCLLVAGGAVLSRGVSPRGVEQGDPLGITLYESGSEVDGVLLEPDGYSWGTQQDPPVLAVRWINKGEEKFTFGAAFDVLYKDKDEWVSCVKGEGVFVDAIGYLLEPGAQMRLEYPLGGFDMSRSGDYRFEVCPDGEHRLWVDFALKYKN